MMVRLDADRCEVAASHFLEAERFGKCVPAHTGAACRLN